ncbi:UNVERIFIED_CONTAM: hypothetical protein GTU68_024960 [Idotea baltica]|nr:hypothetical protein [Idotea baltica]
MVEHLVQNIGGSFSSTSCSRSSRMSLMQFCLRLPVLLVCRCLLGWGYWSPVFVWRSADCTILTNPVGFFCLASFPFLGRSSCWYS